MLNYRSKSLNMLGAKEVSAMSTYDCDCLIVNQEVEVLNDRFVQYERLHSRR
jgi:hypothetical protein